tara:strand:- start:890 stop:1249 length:360 start_codon:yes stop_codon:yes gene_type:complete
MEEHFSPTSLRDLLMAWIPVSVALVLMVIAAKTKERQTHHLLHMISQPYWLTNFAFVVVFCFIIHKFLPHTPRAKALRTAAFHGIVSLAIAVLSEAGLTVGPFWLVFLISYFLGMNEAG